MPPGEQKNRIEELNRALYSRTAPDVRTRRKLRFDDQKPDVQTSWTSTEEKMPDPVLNRAYEDHSMSFFTKLLIGSGIFFVIAIALGAYLFFNGSNLISANNIDIAVNGPVSIPGGEVVSFDVTVTNGNNVDLQTADMAVEFPAGSTDPADPTSELRVTRQLLGDIPAGGSVTKTVKAIIFGEENLQKQIQVSVTYGVKGSTSVFTKSKGYEVLVNSSPITVTATAFKEVASGQEFDLKVNVRSNSQQTLKNVLLKASYPFGYTYVSSNLPPLSDTSTWRIGDIPPNGERVVTIHGKLEGQDNDSRAFRFAIGAQASSDPKSIGTQFTTLQQDITIQKPFVSLKLAVDGNEDPGDHIGRFRQTSRVTITWFNNLSTSVSNMSITAKLSGSAYDKASVIPDTGYFRSSTDEIVWNQQTNPAFARVGAGQSGSVTFSIVPKDLGTPSSPVVNPIVSFKVGVTGNRTQESNASGALTAIASNNIKIPSAISLTGKVLRTIGPFNNTGPIPPKADQLSTYTVVWTVDNTTSIAGNAQVTATLPPYVKWIGAVNPASENVTFDENTGTVTWAIGNLSTNTLSSSRRREAYFQISFLPSVTQADQSPTLVNQAKLTASDTFTGTALESVQDYLTTRFSTDPGYKNGDETVSR